MKHSRFLPMGFALLAVLLLAACQPPAVRRATAPASGVKAFSATYACGTTRLQAAFVMTPDEARVQVDGGAALVLTNQRPASGIWYARGGYELRGKGREAMWTAPGQAPLSCTALDTGS